MLVGSQNHRSLCTHRPVRKWSLFSFLVSRSVKKLRTYRLAKSVPEPSTTWMNSVGSWSQCQKWTARMCCQPSASRWGLASSARWTACDQKFGCKISNKENNWLTIDTFQAATAHLYCRSLLAWTLLCVDLKVWSLAAGLCIRSMQSQAATWRVP